MTRQQLVQLRSGPRNRLCDVSEGEVIFLKAVFRFFVFAIRKTLLIVNWRLFRGLRFDVINVIDAT